MCVRAAGPREFIITGGKREYYLRAKTPALKAAWMFVIASALVGPEAPPLPTHDAAEAAGAAALVAGAAAAAAVAGSSGVAEGVSTVVAAIDNVVWGALCSGALIAASHIADSIPLAGIIGTALRAAIERCQDVSEARGECADIVRHLKEAGESLDYVVQAEHDNRIERGDAVDTGIKKVAATINALHALVDEFLFKSGLEQATHLPDYRRRRTELIATLSRDQVGLLFRLQGATNRKLQGMVGTDACTIAATTVEVR